MRKKDETFFDIYDGIQEERVCPIDAFVLLEQYFAKHFNQDITPFIISCERRCKLYDYHTKIKRNNC